MGQSNLPTIPEKLDGWTIGILDSLVKLESSEERPYFTRNTGQCYVRIGSSKKPATRTTIINLLTNKVVSTEERRRHSMHMCEVYRRLTDASPDQQKDLTLTVTVPSDYQEYHSAVNTLEAFRNRSSIDYVNVVKVDYFDWAIEHLKHEEYSSIYKAWLSTNTFIEQHNIHAKDLLPKFEKLIRNEIKKAYPDFDEGDAISALGEKMELVEYPKVVQKQYFTSKMANVLLESLFQCAQGEEPRLASLEKRPYGVDSRPIVTLQGYQIMSLQEGQDVNVEQLRKTLIQICKDTELNAICKTMVDLLVNARESAHEFSGYLKELVKDIEGGYLLKGKCKLQY